MKKRKIIFINRFYYPDQSATSQILTDLLGNITNKVDADFHVVASRSTYQNDTQLVPNERHNGVNIHRVWTTSFGRNRLSGRAIDYLSFYVSTFFMLMVLVARNDIVIAKTDPPIISFFAYVVARLKRAYLINWLQDLFPEVAGELGMIKKDSLLYRILKKLKNKSLEAADMNVVIGNRMADLLLEQGVDTNKITVIRNWSVNKNIEYVPKESNHLVKEWGLSGKFVICYSGNFGLAHEYEPIKNLVSNVIDENVVFLFIGGGKYYDKLMSYVKAKGLKHVIFKPYQDAEYLNYSLSVADIHIVSLNPALEGLIVPSKFYGVASLGIPVLFVGDKDGEIASVINKNNCGYIVDPVNYALIAKSVTKYIKNRQELAVMGGNIHDLYAKQYQPGVSYNIWLKVLLSKAMLCGSDM